MHNPSRKMFSVQPCDERALLIYMNNPRIQLSSKFATIAADVLRGHTTLFQRCVPVEKRLRRRQRNTGVVSINVVLKTLFQWRSFDVVSVFNQ